MSTTINPSTAPTVINYILRLFLICILLSLLELILLATIFWHYKYSYLVFTKYQGDINHLQKLLRHKTYLFDN